MIGATKVLNDVIWKVNHIQSVQLGTVVLNSSKIIEFKRGSIGTLTKHAYEKILILK